MSAAAKIKQEEMAAHARCDAVKYLATVDCHWYPEAEAALICALRTDRSECVRYEAAVALNNGCCCTKKTVEALRGFLATVLQTVYLPHCREEMGLYARVACRERTITEERVPGRAPTAIGMKRDCSSMGEVTELKDREAAIQAGWRIGDIEVLPRALYKKTPPNKVVVRLRLHSDERLELGQRPENFTRSSKDFAAFFNPNAFRALVAKVLRVPFESRDDFFVDGYDTEYEGVRVFHGEIRSRARSAQLRRDRSEPPEHWWDEMRFLVTDSDPQYFCVQIILREADKLEAS